ncbi:acyclic terpene utilization AtuA family protein [Dietzia sp.]|uniref:acyclic terpene utilization AtuA family protein n=1 Tax=Dietzia sp. TaxID=1871616 RepID=UPI002FD895DD
MAEVGNAEGAPAAGIAGGAGGKALRVANMSARREDRAGAMREFLSGAAFDVLAMDLLSDVAVVRLAGEAAAGGDGFEETFLTQLESAADLVAETGVSIVTNAGALAPEALAARVSALLTDRGIELPVAWIDSGRYDAAGLGTPVGDAAEPGEAEPVAATVSYGAFGIAGALRRGARIVITGRVSREALVLGAAVAHHGWTRDNLDALAGAVAVGHVISGGPGATGTSQGSTDQTRSHVDPVAGGYPVAEIHADGSAIITRHPGAMGSVTVGTVTDQLLDGIGGARYPAPDVVLRIDSLHVEQEGFDRVSLRGARGELPPDSQAAVLVWGPDEATGALARRELRWYSRELSTCVVTHADGSAEPIGGPLRTAPIGAGTVRDVATYVPEVDAAVPGGAPRPAQLGTLAGVRVGALGAGCNIAVWVWDDAAYSWLREAFGVAELEAALPVVASAVTKRYELPNLRAVNFVVDGASPEIQARAIARLGAELRAAEVDVPGEMLEVSP